MADVLRIEPYGEEALRAFCAGEPAPALSRRLAAVAAALRQQPTVRDAVCGYTELVLHLAPEADATALGALLQRHWHEAPEAPAPGREHRIAVRYDGPDLATLATALGLAPQALVARHCAPRYTVALIGFRPHFPYLLGLDPGLAHPRRAEPRRRVPAGSVAIGGEQTGIYPDESPGGWHLIGRCDPACCRELDVGDEVVFVAQ